MDIREVELLILESSFHRTMEYEMRCLRRAEHAEKEYKAAVDSRLRAEHELARARSEFLNGTI